MTMLGKLGLQAFQQTANAEGKPIVTKEFISKVKVRHARIISHGPKPVPEYMQLPVDEYALYDPRMMKRVPADEAAADGTEGAIFELALPTMRPAPGTFAPRPKFRVRVTAQQDELRIESISATLFDDYDETAGVALPPNMTASDMKAANQKLGEQAGLSFNTSLVWAPPKGATSDASTELVTTTSVRLRIRLPHPFTRVPRPLIQGSIGLIMRFVADKILPQFVSLLETDYQRWANGTRDLDSGLGSLVIDVSWG